MGQDDVKTASGEDQVDLLIRQVKNKVDLEGKGTEATSSVPFMKLLTPATAGEKTKIYLGWFFACLTGAILPFFFFLIGPIFDSFTPTSPEQDPVELAEKARDDVRFLCMIMGLLALGITVTSFLQNYLLMSASASVAARLKTRYLQQVLNQESAWYD